MRFLTWHILLGLLGLLILSHVHAELWRCSYPDGSDLYTDRVKDPNTCEKYQPVADLGYVKAKSELPRTAYPQPAPEVRVPPASSKGFHRHPLELPFPPPDDSDFFEDTGFYDDHYPDYDSYYDLFIP